MTGFVILVTQAALTLIAAWALEIALTAAAGGFRERPAMIARALRAPAPLALDSRYVLTADRLFPPLTAGVTVTLGLLVGGFALETPLAPLCDWPTILGLLVLGRLPVLMRALEPGTTEATLHATRAVRLLVPAMAAAGLAVLALGLSAGSLNPMRIGAADDMLAPNAARGMAMAALGWAALADMVAGANLTGRGLDRASEALRRVVWINLLFILIGGAAREQADLTQLMAGLIRWLVWVAAIIAVLTLLRAIMGRPSEAALRRPLFGAAFLSICACLAALSQTGPS